jgi:hypothetical protein
MHAIELRTQTVILNGVFKLLDQNRGAWLSSIGNGVRTNGEPRRDYPIQRHLVPSKLCA